MTCFTLFWTFARIGLCTLGGGAATIPYLLELPARFGWTSPEEMAVIIAVGESAPGPGGVNMAGYIGFEAAGLPGVLCAVAGLCVPSLILVNLIAAFLRDFSKHPAVTRFFYGLRPAVVAVIISAVWGLMQISLFVDGTAHLPAFVIFAAGLVITHLPRTKSVHPLVLVFSAALFGMIFRI
ncbi:chromate transporter [Agathobaculum sp. NTUH-O15-33]|uniref:chromate transporter n=1 Tax=Agathobaculum sp. NTUH-O15-33 TaxID=3079302 RepID=UPI002958B07D|nr:chromate transporter [Agathobaculum sp. NTUH-O15-33]WNX84136.1 chromate transporter [Agathobaculum sp. NTUH-O15-33]